MTISVKDPDPEEFLRLEGAAEGGYGTNSKVPPEDYIEYEDNSVRSS